MSKRRRGIGAMAAIGGALGVVLLSLAAHTADNETTIRILHSGGLVLSLHSLASLIALARNSVFAAAALILGGYLFAGAMALLVFAPSIFIPGLAPASGFVLIGGWLALAWSEFRQKYKN